MSDVPTAEQIAAIYEAATEPDGLARMAAIVRQIIDTQTAGIWLTDRGEIVDLTVTDDIAASTGPYLAYFNRIDPWAKARRMPNEVFMGHEQIDENLLVRGEFYNDFARHFGMLRPMGVILDVAPGVLASVSTNRASPNRLLDLPDKARLRLVAPHIRGALKLRHKLGSAFAARQELLGAIDAFAFGAIVCTADGTVLHANGAARALVSYGLQLGGRQSGLAAFNRADTARLRAAIGAAATQGRPGGVVLAGPDGRQVAAMVTVLPGTRPSLQSGRALVTLRTTDRPAAPSDDMLRRLFDLSPAQASLCGQLARGLTFEEAAAERGIARSTARTHLLGILTRTGTSNLRDLLRLLGSLPPHGAA